MAESASTAANEARKSIQQMFAKIDELVTECPTNIEPVITEFHYLLNKYDEAVLKHTRVPYNLVRDEFDADKMLRQIRDTSGLPDLKIPNIRFKADALSKEKQIPLPNSTRKHKEPLLQWFKIHWEEIKRDVEQWKNQTRNDMPIYPLAD